jgi:cytochrome c peroxidase
LPLRVAPRAAADVRRERRKGIVPLAAPALTEQGSLRASLGRRMFFDATLGGGGALACTRCHGADKAGAGPAQTLPVVGRIETPPLLNLRAYALFGTDGGSASLASYMGSHLAQLSAGADPSTRDVALDSGYGASVRAAFPVGEGEAQGSVLTLSARALAAYLDTLVAPSRVDAFLAGDDSALTPAESVGFDLFYAKGCVSCHDGSAFGGRKMATLGLVIPWVGDAPLGEHIEWKPTRQRRVSSLRSVALTAPYFHEGAIDSLPTAVSLMAAHQLGVTLSDDERAAIVAFLIAMNGPTPPTFRAP